MKFCVKLVEKKVEEVRKVEACIKAEWSAKENHPG